MGKLEIYKVLTAGKRRRYPAIVQKSLIGKVGESCRGKCQAQYCEEGATFIRAWLVPDAIGVYTTYSLNGVRYCDAHASALAANTQLPQFRNEADLNRYHAAVIDHEARHTGDEDAITCDSELVVRFVGPHGSIIMRPNGPMGCESLDGSRLPACCLIDAQHQIGLTSRKVKILHGPECKVGRDIIQTRAMADYRPLSNHHTRSLSRY